MGGRQPAKPGSHIPFYALKPAPTQKPAQVAEKTEDNRPKGKIEINKSLDKAGSARIEIEDAEQEGNKRILIYLSKVKAPPIGEARWRKNEMRRKVSKTVEKELEIRTTVHGIRWHNSHLLERALDIEFPGVVDSEKVKEVIVKAMRIGFQLWEIKGSIVEDWVDVVIPDLDRGKRGDRASQRVEDIAKANK